MQLTGIANHFPFGIVVVGSEEHTPNLRLLQALETGQSHRHLSSWAEGVN